MRTHRLFDSGLETSSYCDVSFGASTGADLVDCPGISEVKISNLANVIRRWNLIQKLAFRWLMTNKKWKKADKIIERAQKLNKKYIPDNLVLKSQDDLKEAYELTVLSRSHFCNKTLTQTSFRTPLTKSRRST